MNVHCAQPTTSHIIKHNRVCYACDASIIRGGQKCRQPTKFIICVRQHTQTTDTPTFHFNSLDLFFSVLYFSNLIRILIALHYVETQIAGNIYAVKIGRKCIFFLVPYPRI